MVDLSVIMVSYNTGPVLFKSIASVLSQNVKEVIIINNGNPKDDIKRLEKLDVKIINKDNIGFAAGCNLGVKHAKSEFILFLNPDCVVISSLKEMLEEFLASKALLSGCEILNPDGSFQKESKRYLLNYKNFFTHSFKLDKLGFANLNYKKNSKYVPAISGAFMLFKKDLYESVQMDEGYFLHVEDMDFCKKISSLGKILYLRNYKVIHYKSSSKASSKFINYNKMKSFYRYFNKYFNNRLANILIYLLCYLRYLCLSRNIASQNYFKIESFEENSAIKGKVIIIAGASSQIGIALIKKLVLNNKIIALYKNNIIDFEHENLSWKYYDFKTLKADYLISAAPLWVIKNDISKFDVKRSVFFSSTSVFAKSDNKSPLEDKIVKNLLASEKTIAKSSNYTIIRPSLVYGYGMDKNIEAIKRFIKKFHFFIISGNGKRSPIHVDDVADSAIYALKTRKTLNSSYNIKGPIDLSYSQMVERVFELNGKKNMIFNLTFFPNIIRIINLVLRTKFNENIFLRMKNDQIFESTKLKQDSGFTPKIRL